MLIKIISEIVLFMVGISIGSFTLNHKSKYIDFCLIILILVFTWIGTSSFLIKIFDFQISFSLSSQLILLGIFINRFLSLYIRKGSAE